MFKWFDFTKMFNYFIMGLSFVKKILFGFHLMHLLGYFSIKNTIIDFL